MAHPHFHIARENSLGAFFIDPNARRPICVAGVSAVVCAAGAFGHAA